MASGIEDDAYFGKKAAGTSRGGTGGGRGSRFPAAADPWGFIISDTLMVGGTTSGWQLIRLPSGTVAAAVEDPFPRNALPPGGTDLLRQCWSDGTRLWACSTARYQPPAFPAPQQYGYLRSGLWPT